MPDAGGPVGVVELVGGTAGGDERDRGGDVAWDARVWRALVRRVCVRRARARPVLE